MNEHRIDEVLDEKGTGQSEERHEDRAEEGLDEDGDLGAEETDQATHRRSAGLSWKRFTRSQEEQVSGPPSGKFLAGHLDHAARRIGYDDPILPHPMEHDEMAEPPFGSPVRDRRKRNLREGFEGSLDSFGREAEPLRGLR